VLLDDDDDCWRVVVELLRVVVPLRVGVVVVDVEVLCWRVRPVVEGVVVVPLLLEVPVDCRSSEVRMGMVSCRVRPVVARAGAVDDDEREVLLDELLLLAALVLRPDDDDDAELLLDAALVLRPLDDELLLDELALVLRPVDELDSRLKYSRVMRVRSSFGALLNIGELL
jgi:hypothetical protein